MANSSLLHTVEMKAFTRQLEVHTCKVSLNSNFQISSHGKRTQAILERVEVVSSVDQISVIMSLAVAPQKEPSFLPRV